MTSSIISEGKLKTGEHFSILSIEHANKNWTERISNSIIRDHTSFIGIFRDFVSGKNQGIRGISYILTVKFKILSQVLIIQNDTDPIGILTFVATISRARRKGSAMCLLKVAIQEFFKNPNHKCLVLQTNTKTFLRKFYEKLGFQITGIGGQMICFRNIKDIDWKLKKRKFEDEYFNPKNIPLHVEKLSWSHIPGLNFLFPAKKGWLIRNYYYGFIGPSEVEIKMYQLFINLFTNFMKNKGEGWVLLSAKDSVVGLLTIVPEIRLGNTIQILDIFVHNRFKKYAYLLTEKVKRSKNIYIHAYGEVQDTNQIKEFENLKLTLKTSFPIKKGKTVGFWVG